MTLADENIADADIEESVNNRLTTADSFTTASQVSQQLDNSFFNVYKKLAVLMPPEMVRLPCGKRWQLPRGENFSFLGTKVRRR